MRVALSYSTARSMTKALFEGTATSNRPGSPLPKNRLSFLVLEEFDLAQTFFCLFLGFVGSTEIFLSIFRENLIAARNFPNHEFTSTRRSSQKTSHKKLDEAESLRTAV
jgi:hypothetical protein